MSTNKLFPFMNRGNINNFNTATQSGIYFIADPNLNYEGNPGINYGVLVVFKAMQNDNNIYIAQLLFRINVPEFYYRTANKETTLAINDWKRVVQS